MIKRIHIKYFSIVFLLLSMHSFAQMKVETLSPGGGKQIILSVNGKTLLEIDSISINFRAQQSQKILFSSDDSIMLELNYPMMPDFNRLETGFDHVLDLGISFRDNIFHFSGKGDWITNFTIHLTDKNDHYFGLRENLFPLNKRSPDLRGSTIDIEVEGEQFRYAENFASAFSTFFFNPKGYASFMNTFARGKYQLAIEGQTSLFHETNTIDWYVFSGESRDIYSNFYKVTGAPKHVPVWACGPMIWRDENKNGSDEILDDVRHFNQLSIPLTSVMVDRPYSNGALAWSKMDFNEQFKNPHQWIAALRDSFGLKFLTWIAPATYGDTSLPGLLPGAVSYIDLTNAKAVRAFAEKLKLNQYDNGVAGHKMDRADENFPVTEEWSDRTPRAERKNKYVFLYAKTIDSILTANLKEDQFNYARAAIHGSHHYLSGIWGGDPRSTWEGLAGNLANAIRASCMGFPNWGTDVGGYLGQSGKIADDLYIRWLQWGAFTGIFEIKLDGAGGAGEDRCPWHCSKRVQEAFRKACEMRMSWLPHIYSQLNTSAENGTLIKPLVTVYPDDTTTYQVWDEYIFGNTLLVAPVWSPDTVKKIYLPEGDWIDYYSGNILTGKRFISVTLSDTAIPLFVKSNSIHVKGNINVGNERLWKRGSEFADIYYYPGEGNASMDFIDKGNGYPVRRIEAKATAGKITMSVPGISYEGKVKMFLKKRPSVVYVNGLKQKFQYRNNWVMVSRKPNQPLTMEIR